MPEWRFAAGPLDRPGEFVPVERAEDFFQGHPDLDPGEVCTQTEMGTVPEAEMGVRVAPEAELIWLP